MELDLPGDQIPLVVAGEDEGFLLGLAPVPGLLGLDLQVDEAANDLQNVVRGQHLVPQIASRVAVDILGQVVARTTILGAPAEGEEVRRPTRKPSGHVRLVLTDGEVNERTPLECEQRLGLVGLRVFGEARLFVLLDGVLDCLLELTLKLHRGDGDAVQEEH